MTEKGKVAILIDAENVSYKNAKQIVDTMKEFGEIIIKDIIADWTKFSKVKQSKNNGDSPLQKLKTGWRKVAADYAMTATQQFTYVPGKNSSDMALTILAMKILYEKPYIDTFCIVSSDSDFTPLAQEIKSCNKTVIGMGMRTAVLEFTKAYNEYLYLGEALPQDVVEEKKEISKETEEKIKASKNTIENIGENAKEINGKQITQKQLEFLSETIDNLIEEYHGVAYYSLIKREMPKLSPEFTHKNFDCSKISDFIDKVLPYLEGYDKKEEMIQGNENGRNMMLVKRV